MLFNSFVFLIFLPATVVLYYTLLRKSEGNVAIALLVVASLIYYGWSKPEYIVLIVFSAVFNFWMARLMHDERPQAIRRVMLIIGVTPNLPLLAYFKYSGFLYQNFAEVFSTNMSFLGPVLPLAISFFTFQQIAFLVDRYRLIAKEPSFTTYLLFVCFFPQLIAGPIVHHREMMPQFENVARGIRLKENLAVGLTIFSIGLFKKVGIADSLAPYADMVFDAASRGNAPDTISAWRATAAYSFQIYFDFSGYSDMAVGVARLFGIVLPINFFSPYRATSIIEFWRRWHMTLSRFLRDYLYISMGGNRKGAVRWAINIMITMLLGGLWHGAGWTFVIWGGLHGAMLLINHLWRRAASSFGLVMPRNRGMTVGSHLLTFICVCIAWVFFRADSLPAAMLMLSGLVGQNDPVVPLKVTEFGIAYLMCAAAFVIVVFLPNTAELLRDYRPVLPYTHINLNKDLGLKLTIRWQPSVVWAISIAVILFVGLLRIAGGREFIYYAF
jgi:D-alanyl-lipoteichoic acid acyltransferase DltB (MBOAT superfamily)